VKDKSILMRPGIPRSDLHHPDFKVFDEVTRIFSLDEIVVMVNHYLRTDWTEEELRRREARKRRKEKQEAHRLKMNVPLRQQLKAGG